MPSLNDVCAKVIVAAAVLVLPACAHNPIEPTPVDPSSAVLASSAVVSGTWSLQSMTRPDSSSVAITQAGQFTLQLGEDSRIALRADCNRATGYYTLIGTTLMVGPLAATKAYCPSAPLDDEYLRMIGGSTVINATATALEISSPRGTLRFGK